jgi:hypothetical protein
MRTGRSIPRPPVGVEQWYARELKTTAASIRAYERATYYAGQWERLQSSSPIGLTITSRSSARG